MRYDMRAPWFWSLLFLVFLVAATAGAARAADAPATTPPAVSWTPVVVAALAALGIGARLVRWAVKHRRLLRIVIDVLEYYDKCGDVGIEAALVKITEQIAERVRDGEDAETMDTECAKAERNMGGNGRSTTRVRARRPVVQALKFGARFFTGRW